MYYYALLWIVTFPLYSFVIYFIFYFVLLKKTGEPHRASILLKSISIYIHLFTLILTLTLNAYFFLNTEVIFGMFITKPDILWVVLSIPLGIALFEVELRIKTKLVNSSTQDTNNTSRISECFLPNNFLISLLLLTAIPLLEELIWRGMLIGVVSEKLAFNLYGTIMLSAISYGSIHLYFGLKEASIKTLSGIIFSILFMASGSIIVPFLTHATMNFKALKYNCELKKR